MRSKPVLPSNSYYIFNVLRLYNLKYIYQILCKQSKKAYIYCFKLNLEFYFVDEFVGLSKFEIELYRIKKLIKLLEIQIKELEQ